MFKFQKFVCVWFSPQVPDGVQETSWWLLAEIKHVECEKPLGQTQLLHLHWLKFIRYCTVGGRYVSR